MGISSSGLISGLNVDQLVSGLINLERQPIITLQSRQKDYELKIASVLDISTKLSSFKSAIETLNSAEKFSTKTVSVTKNSSGAELLTATASSTATAGSYSVTVSQLATANKKASQGWVDQNTTAITSSSGTFKFKVGSGGTEYSVDYTSSTTLQGLRDAINSKNAGVTASILNDGTGSNPYRLVLQANSSGSSNTLYITQNNTDLDFTNKKIEAAYAYTTNGYAGTVTSNSGTNSSTYASTTNKTYLVEIVTGGAPGTATYKYSTDGGITFKGYDGSTFSSTAGTDISGGAISTTTDYTNEYIDGTSSDSADSEGVKIKFSAGSNLVAGDRFTVDVFNPEMQAAQDAVIKVDNTTITKSTNAITDAIQGITLNLLKTDSSAITVTVSSDTTTAKTNIKSFVDSYNTVIKFINDQLSYDPKLKKKNPLLGDPTMLEIRKKIGDIVSGKISGLTTASYQNLSQIGIASDKTTGKLSLDDSKLSSALSSNPNAVAKLFIGTGAPSNSAITYVSKTSKTQGGSYAVNITTAPAKATTGTTNANDRSSTGLSTSETVTFSYSEDYTSTSPTTTYFSVTLNSGSAINTIVDTLNTKFATQKVKLSASNSSGRLNISSTEFGADIWFDVSSSTYGANQVWSADPDSGNPGFQGTNIAGTINGHSATGKGNILTGISGFPEEGLKISTETNQTGGFGTVAVSLGVADRLPSILNSYTNSSTGVLKSKEQSIQKTVDLVKDQQTKIEDRLVSKEQRLREQFTRLEVLLGKLNTQSQYVTAQLAKLGAITGDKK
jgi:flagellar hook-associated protein 2